MICFSRVFLIGLIVALVCCAVYDKQVRAQGSQQGNSGSEEELRRAQIDYFKAQTEKLRYRSFKESLLENFVGLVTAFGAFIAALIALSSLIINRRLTIRNQKDTQFYEALKRFGDKDSIRLRSSAAGLLAQLAREKSIFTRRQPYFRTTVNQLVTGILLETDFVVLGSICDALEELSPFGRRFIAQNLWDAKYSLLRKLQRKVTQWALSKNITELEDFTNAHLAELADVSTMAPFVVRGWLSELEEADTADKKAEVVKRFKRQLRLTEAQNRGKKVTVEAIHRSIVEFSDLLDNATRCLIRVVAEVPMSRLDRLQRLIDWPPREEYVDLTLAWLMNADLSRESLINLDLSWSRMDSANLSYSKLRNVSLRHAFLKDANMSFASFYKVDLAESDLRGADLSNLSFEGVRLNEAKINDQTNLNDCNWWAANFYTLELPLFLRRFGNVDANLLEKIFEKHKEKLSYIKSSESDVHPSVRAFIKARNL
jgi:hypothetical protein